MPFGPRACTAAGLVLTLLASGCATATDQTRFMRSRENLDVGASTAEMRLRTVAYARRATGLIEETADEIALESDDPAVRKAALRWKINAIPMVQEAALQPDPLIAAGDLWALFLQMGAYFSEGEGRDVFGPFQPLAVATCQELAAAGEGVMRAALRGGDTAVVRDSVETFARENPIQTRSLRRTPITIEYADVLFSGSRSTFDAVGDVEQTARDIDYRLGFLSEYMFKQARWTVELALLDAANRVEVDEAMQLLRDALAQVQDLAGQVPELVDVQRESLFAALAAERAATLSTIDAQRLDTLLAISREREAVFAGIEEQREELVALLQLERQAILGDLEGVVERSLSNVVDHAVWRGVQLGLAGAVVVLLLVLGVRWLGSRSG